MRPLLFLAHRIPYPPNKGDKVRSYHLLRHLAERYRVHLGAFVDAREDWAHAQTLRQWCAGLCLRPLHPRLKRLASARALLSGEALTLAYFRDRALAAWAAGTVRAAGVRHAVAFSSAMAQYVRGPAFAGVRRVVDMVDVDSEKWRAYGARRHGPMAWVYRREADRLLAFERTVAAEADATVFVSAEEAALFRSLAPEAAARVSCLDNGVDTAYFDPTRDYPNPYRAGERVLAFTGAMDYWANVDAVSWFAEAVFPRVRAGQPQARFYVVGARPSEAVRRLARLPGVQVTGAVADVRPYLRHARAAVAPMRIARGVQNKVLEAMAMNRPVIATPAAMEGIRVDRALCAGVTEDPAQMAILALKLLENGTDPDPDHEPDRTARAQVRARHDWDANLAALDALLD